MVLANCKVKKLISDFSAESTESTGRWRQNGGIMKTRRGVWGGTPQWIARKWTLINQLSVNILNDEYRFEGSLGGIPPNPPCFHKLSRKMWGKQEARRLFCASRRYVAGGFSVGMMVGVKISNWLPPLQKPSPLQRPYFSAFGPLCKGGKPVRQPTSKSCPLPT